VSADLLASLPCQVTPTMHLRRGDLFTTDAGSGVLVFVQRNPDHRYPGSFSSVTALDLTGGLHREVFAGRQVHRLLDLDTLPSCDVCEDGCYCTKDDPGCGHFGCYAAKQDSTCPGALAVRVFVFQRTAQRQAVAA
jgi:hypothetical protein